VINLLPAFKGIQLLRCRCTSNIGQWKNSQALIGIGKTKGVIVSTAPMGIATAIKLRLNFNQHHNNVMSRTR
jgi:hypothetical protein